MRKSVSKVLCGVLALSIVGSMEVLTSAAGLTSLENNLNTVVSDAMPTPTPIDLSPTDTSEYDYDTPLPANSDIDGVPEATQEEMDYWAQRAKDYDYNEDPDVSIPGARASWVYLDPFTYYDQQRGNSCTVACLRMALKYITGSTPSEDTIIKSTGVPCSINNAVTYFNDYTTDYEYTAKFQASKSTMKTDLYNAVNNEVPPIVGLNPTLDDGWPYEFRSHAVTVYSVMSDKSQFAVCDPYAGYADEPESRWYDRTADEMFRAYDAHNSGYMY